MDHTQHLTKDSAPKVVVIGQGYVGLPVAVRAAEVGYRVVGLDNNEARVAQLRRGESYIEDVSSERLQAALAAGSYTAASSYTEAVDFDIAVISVPTPLVDMVPDLSYVEQAASQLSPLLRAGATVILESTTYPGTTEEMVGPILEEGSGLRVGADFHLGYSPERIDPGNEVYGLVETPKIVSGVNEESLKVVDQFFRSIVNETVAVSGTREAELAKLLENTFRYVNIALVNEMAVVADQLGINIWETINAASTKPFGFMRFTPGPGVGGHCLPVDPSYLTWQARRQTGESMHMVDAAHEINQRMPLHVVDRVGAMLNERSASIRGSKVLLVGISYKKGTGDVRESPAFKIAALLLKRGAQVIGVDPHVVPASWPAGVERATLDERTIEGCDLAVVVTDHDEFDLQLLTRSDIPVFDTRNALSGHNVSAL